MTTPAVRGCCFCDTSVRVVPGTSCPTCGSPVVPAFELKDYAGEYEMAITVRIVDSPDVTDR